MSTQESEAVSVLDEERPQSDRMLRSLTAVVVGLGALARISLIGAGLPYTTYIDEYWTLSLSAHQLAEGTWNPGLFWYGSLLPNATTLLAFPVSWITGDDLAAGARTTERSPYVEVIEPRSLVLSGRLVVVACAIATMVLVVLIARRLGGERAGLVTALVAAVLPLWLARSAVVITDTVGTCFVALALYGTVRLLDEPRSSRWQIVTGVGVGLAFSAKYVGVLVAIPVAAVVLTSTATSARDRVRSLAMIGCAAVGSAVVTMPALVMMPSKVLHDIRWQMDLYSNKPASASYLQGYLTRSEVGIFLLVAGLVGLGWLLISRRSRALALGGIALLAIFYVAFSRSPFQPQRNLMPVTVLPCAAIGVMVADVSRRVERRFAKGVTMRKAVGLGFVVVAALVLVVPSVPRARGLYLHDRQLVDTRSKVREWLSRHTDADDTVLIAEEAEFLPSELERVPARAVVVEQDARSDGSVKPDYVVAGAFPTGVDEWRSVVAGRPKLAQFGSVYLGCHARARARVGDPDRCPSSDGTFAWHHNDAMLTIYGPRATRPGS